MPPRRRVVAPETAILFNPPTPTGSKWKQFRKKPLTQKQIKAMKDAAKEKEASHAPRSISEKYGSPKAKRDNGDAGKDASSSDGDGEGPKGERTEERDLQRVPDFGRNPCTILICGKSGAGKTTAITNALNPDDYDNVFIITATAHKHNLTHMVKDEAFILEDMSDTFINMLTEHHQKNTKATTLLLFDDHVGINFNFKTSKPYKKLCAAARNFKITIVDSCQDIAEVPKILRRNAHWLLFGNNYDANNDFIADQLSIPDLPKAQFAKVLRGLAKRREYEWLVYDDKKQDWWIWKPEFVEGLGDGDADDSDDSDDDSADDSEEDEGRNEITEDAIPNEVKSKGKKRNADAIGLGRASQDAKKMRKN